MAAVLNLANFTFTDEQIRSVNELIFDEVLNAPELTLLCTVFPGVVSGKEVGFIGEGGLVGKARQGCNPTPQQWNIAARKVLWQPKAWEILIEQCWTDLESTAAVYSLKTGRDIADFIDTDYMAIIYEVLTKAIKKFIIRLFWFNDQNVATVADGGYLTNGTDIEYFNILNGFWKQIQEQVTANAAQLVTITENAGANYAAQVIAPANIQNYLQKLVFGAPILLRNMEGAVIACTQSFYDAYAMSLQGVQLETMFANLMDGQRTLTYNGIPLVPMPIWDEIIRSYENDGTKLYMPNRAVYMHKDFFAAGVDGDDSFEKLETWYNKDERTVKTEAMGKADAVISNPALFAVAI